MEMSQVRTKKQKGKNLLVWKCHVTMSNSEAYVSNKLQHQSHSLTFLSKIIQFFQLPAFYLNDQTS